MKKFLVFLLTLLMVLSVLPVSVTAKGAVNVTFSAQKDGAFLFNRKSVEVTDGLAEEYGYTVALKDHNNVEVDKPTVFDALVAIHKAKYKDAFTNATAKDYLDISSTGSVLKAFGQSAAATSFFVNGAMLNDGIVGTYGTTGYAIDAARLNENDNVDFWFYQDDYYLDYYTCFTETEKNVTENEQFTLTLNGFMAMSAMGYEPTAEAINGEDGYITIHTVGSDGSISEALKDSDDSELLINADGQVSLSFSEAGKYYVTANGMEGDLGAPIVAPWCVVNVSPAPLPPTAITIVCDDTRAISATSLLAKNGDAFKFTALDQDGNETPVKWSTTSSYVGSIDENSGILTTTASFSSGGTSSASIRAVSVRDENISKAVSFSLVGYMLSSYQKNPTVALSSDGQGAKTVSVTGGYNGKTNWSYDINGEIAKLASDQDLSAKRNSIKFDALRPGTFTATFTLDNDESMTDTATFTVTGVAVEDSEGNRAKTYLTKTVDEANPSVQLTAFTEEGKAVTGWTSSDESVAAVDENGLVSATGVGTALITAIDDTGAKGGINVVVQDSVTPYFENIQFLSSAITSYASEYSFSPTTTEYELLIKAYSTSKLTFQNTTVYNTEKYIATASYTDINDVEQIIDIKSGAITYLDNIPFGESDITVTLSDKENRDNRTVYTYKVTRPRDTTKTIKNSTGIVLVPSGRALSSVQYNGKPEGTMFRVKADGTLDTATGASASQYLYKCFALNDFESFSLTLKGATAYEHIRYSYDNGENWVELPQGGGNTEDLKYDGNDAHILIQIADDKTYTEISGFSDENTTYTVVIEQITTNASDAQIITADSNFGDWYPAFSKDINTYVIAVPSASGANKITFTVSEGSTVKLGNTALTPDENGNYTLELKETAQTVAIASNDGAISNSYNFKLQKNKEGYPDKVSDFLCINSQYTNGAGFGNGASPWVSLAGTITSLGNFGGYITYYYDEAITDNPNNKYGVDFYVYGNASKDTSTATKTSFFEPAQAWVSEDGESWYALAGSAHYDEGVDRSYSVNYLPASNGKTAWTDSLGNSNDGSAYTGAYPKANSYFMNSLASSDSITLSGILLPARSKAAAVSGVAIDAYPIKWGYADCFPNGTIGADVNPYQDNSDFSLSANGFDLSWAVDADGNPIDVSNKEFHYVKLVTASNIWHPSFGEKSPEIAGMVITKPQVEEVGKTLPPSGVTITDGAESKTIIFTENKTTYSLNVGDMKYVSISVNGADETDNIYINNERILYNEALSGFKITKKSGERLVRVLVQSGDKEPAIYLLKLTGTATESDELIENIKIDASGDVRTATTKNGVTYTNSVGYRIDEIKIIPVSDSNVSLSINGESIKDSYPLQEGENTFTIRGENGELSETVILKITKAAAPSSSGKLRVYFTLLGDDIHGEDEEHTLKNGGLKTWIKRTAYEVNSPATVLDVLEKALTGQYTFVNADGNYISEIDGLKEFSNGPNSGWLYTINGSHLSKGVAEQSVKNGDVIVFHYTDDYTKEQDTEKISGGGGSVATYTVAFDSDGGTEIKSQSINRNSLSVSPENPEKEGYIFDGWYKDKAFTERFDFSKKVTSDLTLYAKWIKAYEKYFTDVVDTAWYCEAVNYVCENKIMTGISETEFAPNDNITRAMLVTIIYRLENEPKAATSSFSDVSDNSWYSEAVSFANANGIVYGTSQNEFSPDANITREQMATIIYRYAQYKKYDVSVGENTSIISYDDFADISEYATASLKYAVGSGIMTGKTDKILNPKATATRAETATVIMKMLKNIK